ncbi:hypothetical protein M0R45_023876 [Rubus argutus]|uniref:Uncharacterized protein n=1 Tax=Rubus argutus TaxID=59490 RepID=A0AAW1WP22_RUBAR
MCALCCFSKDDVTVLTALAKPPSLAFVNVVRLVFPEKAVVSLSREMLVTVKGDAPVPVADTKASLASPFLSAYSDVCLPLHYLMKYHIDLRLHGCGVRGCEEVCFIFIAI